MGNNYDERRLGSHVLNRQKLLPYLYCTNDLEDTFAATLSEVPRMNIVLFWRLGLVKIVLIA